MELRQYVRMLRGHWLLIAATVLVCTLAAAFLTASSAPSYHSTTKLLVFSRGGGADLGESYQGDLLATARVKTYAELVTGPAVMQGVIDRLGLPDSVASLQGRVRVTQPKDTTLIIVTVDGSSRTQARATAEAVADQFAEYVSGVERARASTASRVAVTPVQAATVAADPVGRHRLFDLSLGLLAGLALGVAAAVLREYVAGRVRDEADLTGHTDAPVLVLPAGRPRTGWRRLGLTGRVWDEAYRDLASVMLRVQEDRGGGPIVVLGVTRTAGGSEVTTQVARALARSGVRVALVTGTWDEVGAARVSLGAVPDAGPGGPEAGANLFDVLAGRAPLAAALRPVEGEPSLLLLPADTSSGPRPALDTRLVTKLVADLQERADVVLFDAPPLDESVDGAVLAAACGGALLVVRPGHTRRRALVRAIEELQALSTPLCGVVFNPGSGSSGRAGAAGLADTQHVR